MKNGFPKWIIYSVIILFAILNGVLSKDTDTIRIVLSVIFGGVLASVIAVEFGPMILAGGAGRWIGVAMYLGLAIAGLSAFLASPPDEIFARSVRNLNIVGANLLFALICGLINIMVTGAGQPGSNYRSIGSGGSRRIITESDLKKINREN